MKPKEKGDIALSHAIRYYMSNSFEVCLPIGDKRDYDLIVEKDNNLQRVQVKYAGLYPSKTTCKVALRITGGNQSFNYSKRYSDNAFDILFVYTAKKEMYQIDWKTIKARNELSIETEKYKSFQLINDLQG